MNGLFAGLGILGTSLLFREDPDVKVSPQSTLYQLRLAREYLDNFYSTSLMRSNCRKMDTHLSKTEMALKAAVKRDPGSMYKWYLPLISDLARGRKIYKRLCGYRVIHKQEVVRNIKVYK